MQEQKSKMRGDQADLLAAWDQERRCQEETLTLSLTLTLTFTLTLTRTLTLTQLPGRDPGDLQGGRPGCGPAMAAGWAAAAASCLHKCASCLRCTHISVSVKYRDCTWVSARRGDVHGGQTSLPLFTVALPASWLTST